MRWPSAGFRREPVASFRRSLTAKPVTDGAGYKRLWPYENGIAAIQRRCERDPSIHAWMKEHAGELGVIALQWFETMRKCGYEVRELLHDGCPVACVGDAPFGYVNVFTSHVNVGFFHGAALSRLIEAAYSDIKERVENG